MHKIGRESDFLIFEAEEQAVSQLEEVSVPVSYRPTPSPPPLSIGGTVRHRAVIAPLLLSTIAVISIISFSAYVGFVNRNNGRPLANKELASDRLLATHVVSEKLEVGSISSSDNLTVAGPSQFHGITNNGSLIQNGTAVFSGTLTQEIGDAEFKGALNVKGQTTLGGLTGGAASVSSLLVKGATTSQSLTVNQGLTVADGGLTVSGGNAALAGNLSVNGPINGLTIGDGVISVGTWKASVIGSQFGGTGLNSSSSTGVPSLSSGTWSISSLLGTSLGGTGLNSSSSTGVPSLSSGTWSI